MFKYYLIVLNILGCLAMYIDKEKAKANKFRIRERTLMLIALLGGSIGSYIGMIFFKHKTRHFKFKYGILIIILAQLGLFFYLGNNKISTSHYYIKTSKIPSEFNGYKIVQISDLHSKVFPGNNKELVKIIKNEKPDAIVITGDIVDRRRYDEEKALMLIKEMKSIAPIYYVTGNHEAWSGKFTSLQKKLIDNKVLVLRNKSIPVKRGTHKIFISGVDDPGFGTKGYKEDYKDYNIVKNEIEKIKKDGYYNILLCHRPELFSLYVNEKIDLVFTGHSHGGQAIIPFIGGIIAPNQGLFPKYYKGVHNEKDTSMVISRGLGNSLAPIRVFNHPEVVVVKIIGDV